VGDDNSLCGFELWMNCANWQWWWSMTAFLRTNCTQFETEMELNPASY
jgi:hypothetical protein